MGGDEIVKTPNPNVIGLETAAISVPYLLVLFSVPIYRDEHGLRHVDQLWAKDLAQHLKYLKKLTLCCYECVWAEGSTNLVCIDDNPDFEGLRVVAFPKPSSLAGACLRIPATAIGLWREVRQCQIVHSAVVGWPLPEAWFVTPMARWLKRPHVIIVESAPWRENLFRPHVQAWRRWWSRLQELTARICLDRSDLAIFTHEGYRQSLLSDPSKGHIIEASWIDDAYIVDKQSLATRNSANQSRPGLRMAFFGRLSQAKGVLDLMAACKGVLAHGCDIYLDVYGAGELGDELTRLVGSMPSNRIRMCGTVEYGPMLFERIRTYDAVVVPTSSDEQPRIIYDAFSQGVAVIASDTQGHRQCVSDEVTGQLFTAGDVIELEHAISSALANKPRWLAMGMDCREKALSHTHWHMHERRLALLRNLL
jgi:glycosyltransferase involved in cell wall biosynthesis